MRSDLRGMSDLQGETDRCLKTLQGDVLEEITGYKQKLYTTSSNFKLGKEAKQTNNVKVALRWPLTAVKYNVDQLQVAYNKLDFALLVAGEVSIINGPETSRDKRYGRLELLKATAYHSRNFQWKDVLNFRGTCLLEVEKGECTWGRWETFLATEASSPYSNASSKGSGETPEKEGRRWFCKTDQQGKCKHNGAHGAMVWGS